MQPHEQPEHLPPPAGIVGPPPPAGIAGPPPPEHPSHDRDGDPRGLGWLVAVMAAVLAALLGAAMLLVGLLFGHCSAFGGTCPADPQPLWDDDVFRLTVAGLALIVVPAIAVIARTWRQRLRGIAVAAPLCVVFGVLAANWAAG